jgi:hypothetical protein
MHRVFASTDGQEWKRATLDQVPHYKACSECKRDRNFKGAVWYKKQRLSELNWKAAWERGNKIATRTGGKDYKLIIAPSDSLSIDDVDSQLDYWEDSEGFIADFIFIDYGDNLRTRDPRLQSERDRQNDTWKAARSLSQRRNLALFMPTQADAASYDKKSLGEGNFSEDKRKYGHATSFITLHQTKAEKKAGILRIGNMFVREDDYEVNKHCTVLQCLDMGRPYIDSYI